MQLIDLLTSPWAILPERLLEIQAIYATHLRGEKIDLNAIEARLGRPLAKEQQEYSVREGGVAVLPIEGVIAPKANLFTRISGGASAQMLQLQLESAMADSRVRSIVLLVDSPGGSVFGSPELAGAVRAFAGEKPIVALSDGVMASAAYWIGSAANQVFVTGPTVQVGSVGVVATHEYRPNAATVSTDITAGRYKRIASSGAPLSDEGRAYLQEQVDHIYSVFVDTVAAHRGVKASTVLERMADGRVFIGQQAIDAGLVDGVSTLDALVARMAADPAAFLRRSVAKPKAIAAVSAQAEGDPQLDTAGAADESATPPLSNERTVMPQADTPLTVEAMERDHPALLTSLRSRYVAEGATAERQRIADVRSQSLPGHEALVERLAMDGKTTGPEAAAAVLAAERSSRAAAAAAHAADAPPAAPAAPASSDKPSMSKDEQAAKAKAYAAEHKVDFVAALKALGFAN